MSLRSSTFLEDDWLNGCLYNDDVEDSNIQVGVNNGTQVLQGVCGDLVSIGDTDSNFENNMWHLKEVPQLGMQPPSLSFRCHDS